MAPTKRAVKRETEDKYPHLQAEEAYRIPETRPPTAQHIVDGLAPSAELVSFDRFERRVCDRCSHVRRYPDYYPYRGFCPHCARVTSQTPLVTAFGRTMPTGGWLDE